MFVMVHFGISLVSTSLQMFRSITKRLKNKKQYIISFL